jgi:hypothetical protein
MKKLRATSRILHLFLLCCFFMPFLKSCDLEKNEAPFFPADSLGISAPLDSFAKQPLVFPDGAGSINDDAQEDAWGWLKVPLDILLPGGDYSGIFLVITSIESDPQFPNTTWPVAPSFIFLISSMCLVFRKNNDRRGIFVFSVMSTFFLGLFMFQQQFHGLMIGTWLASIFFILNNIVCYLFWKKGN